MKQYLSAVLLVLSLCALVHAGPSHKLTGAGAEAAARVESDKIIQNIATKLDKVGYPKEKLLSKFDRAFDEITQETAKAEESNEEYQLNQQILQNLYLDDTDKQLKGVLLARMQRMYESMLVWMENYNHGHGHQQHVHATMREKKNYFKVTTEIERQMDEYLHKKMNELQSKQQAQKQQKVHRNDRSVTAHVSGTSKATIMGSQSTYLPIFKFDRTAGNNCYPDWPSSANDNTCREDLDSNAPVFYEVETCGEETVYTYWLWYGWQRPCIKIFDTGHGNDWEHVSVHVNPSTGLANSVVYHQHGGHYTRRRDRYQREGERPIVYIGKIAHGSYHSRCKRTCSLRQFFRYGCVGTVEFCVGGCGYWEDFRNPEDADDELRNGQLYPLNRGQVIDGIERPARKICTSDIGTCDGFNSRSLFESGCWQDEP